MTSQYNYAAPQSQKYSSLQSNRGPIPRPPQYHKYPPPSHRRSSGSGCGFLKCICCCWYFSCCRWCMCILFSMILIMLAVLFGLYYFLQPHVPYYNVENLDVKAFNLKNNRLSTDIVVSVKADNPNEGIGLEYLPNDVTILYSGTELSKGQFPSFLQPGKNVTIFDVSLKGDIDFGLAMQHQLLVDQKLGHIPLLIMVKAPVKIVLDDIIRFRRFVVLVNCSVIIDQLKPNMRPKILDKKLTYGYHL